MKKLNIVHFHLKVTTFVLSQIYAISVYPKRNHLRFFGLWGIFSYQVLKITSVASASIIKYMAGFSDISRMMFVIKYFESGKFKCEFEWWIIESYFVYFADNYNFKIKIIKLLYFVIISIFNFIFLSKTKIGEARLNIKTDSVL